MWIKKEKVRTSGGKWLYRFVCSECGLSKDCFEEPKKCKHSPGAVENIWNSIVRGSKGQKGRYDRPVELNITKAYIILLFQKQKGVCALSGLPIILGDTASLDRIDPSKGYLKDNVWWIHKDLNKMKSAFSLEHFIYLCGVITLNNS